MRNTKQLGKHQRDMLSFIERNDRGEGRMFHIQRDRLSRRVARSLSNRGLINLWTDGQTCWRVSLKEGDTTCE